MLRRKKAKENKKVDLNITSSIVNVDKEGNIHLSNEISSNAGFKSDDTLFVFSMPDMGAMLLIKPTEIFNGKHKIRYIRSLIRTLSSKTKDVK